MRPRLFRANALGATTNVHAVIEPTDIVLEVCGKPSVAQ